MLTKGYAGTYKNRGSVEILIGRLREFRRLSFVRGVEVKSEVIVFD